MSAHVFTWSLIGLVSLLAIIAVGYVCLTNQPHYLWWELAIVIVDYLLVIRIANRQ
jgi:hypothetical protein